MRKPRSGGKKRRPVNEHFKLAYRQSSLDEFVEEPSENEGSNLSPDLVDRLSDLELRLSHLEGKKVFTSSEPAKAMNEIMSSNPQMSSVNSEFKKLLALGKVKIAM